MKVSTVSESMHCPHTLTSNSNRYVGRLCWKFLKYSRILLIRHLKGIRKKWWIRRSDELRKQVKTL